LNIARGNSKKKLIDGTNHSRSGAPYFSADGQILSLIYDPRFVQYCKPGDTSGT